VKIFVYGSLLSGEGHHSRLAASRAIGARRTLPCYTLVDLGPYPALLEHGTTSVDGELYEVDDATLARIDAFEGHPALYERVAVRLVGGEAAQAYVLRDTRLAQGRPVVAGGDWRRAPRSGRAPPPAPRTDGRPRREGATTSPMRFEPRRGLGRTGFRATVVGAGDLADATLGLETCATTLRRALDAGINVVDTAPAYEDGLSERVVGRALAGRRDGVFVIDKIDHLDRPVAPQIDASVARLGFSPDAFVFHAVSRLEDWEALAAPGGGMDRLSEQARLGKCRFRGVSSHHPDVVRAAILSGACDVVMLPVGAHVDPRYTAELLPLARERGVGTVGFKTFGAGMLVADTAGYGKPLPPGVGPGSLAPPLSVDDCVRAALTYDADVALLGLSTREEQDAAFEAVARFSPLSAAELRDVRRRAAEAVRGKGVVWWDPPPA